MRSGHHPWDDLADLPAADTAWRPYRWRDPARVGPRRLALLADRDRREEDLPGTGEGHDTTRTRAVHWAATRFGRQEAACHAMAASPAYATDPAAVTCRRCKLTTPYLNALGRLDEAIAEQAAQDDMAVAG